MHQNGWNLEDLYEVSQTETSTVWPFSLVEAKFFLTIEARLLEVGEGMWGGVGKVDKGWLALINAYYFDV